MNSRQSGLEGPLSASGMQSVRAAVADALRRARGFLELRQFAEAQRLYSGVLVIDPDNVEALHLLGIAFFQAGDPLKAEPLIARSLKLGLKKAWNLANYASVLSRLGRDAEALTLLDQALTLDAGCVPAVAARATALLSLGRHAEALAGYERALELAPGLAEAWRGRGTTLLARKRPADALISFDRALRIVPHDAETHIQRGHALRELGRLEDALQSYRLALVIRPKATDILSLCGLVLVDLGREVEALACLDEALAIQPDDQTLLYQSCVALDLVHRFDELLARCDRLLTLNPQHAAAWLGRGNALHGLYRHEEAAEAYGHAHVCAPDMKDALRNQAAALRMLGRNHEALDCYDRALIAGPDTELLYNRGIALQQLGRVDDAVESYRAAVAAPAETAQSRFTRAVALQQLGRNDEAMICYEEARNLDPHHALARRSEALCRLLVGDFRQGWVQHESRWLEGDAMARRRYADHPLWRGVEPVAGKTVLLHAEQGYGDSLQFCRYAALVAARGATVVLEVPGALKALLSSLQGVARVVSEGDQFPPFDLQCPMMSLPLAFGTDLETIPADVPYLSADVRRKLKWEKRLDELAPPGRPRIGLAWSGNPRHSNDENRSIPLAALEAVYRMPATFVSLQPLVRERDADVLAQSGILRFEAELADFADSAALVDALDMVISVDTSVAHLAGALGRPVWLLLPRAPDWRWMLDREDSPWYPSVRLFRQKKPGDWATVIQRVTQELGSEAAKNWRKA